MTDLWLDDERKPPTFSDCGIHWTWAKTYDEAVEILKTKTIVFASLDHDLSDEHYQAFHKARLSGQPMDTSSCKEKTGYDVLLWMLENDIWPKQGVRIHTMNTVRKPIMLDMVQDEYGRTFQHQYAGTHKV